MPVADHPIHEKTILRDGTPYGCWNKPRKDGYWVANGKELYPEGDRCGMFVLCAKWVPDVFRKGPCPYDQRANDQRCIGCSK